MEKQPSILIVDDEKNIRLTLSQALEPSGFQIATAVNGEEALAKMEKEEFGLVLLDLRMPGMDGMEVLRRLRDLRPDIGVIIITAHGTVDSAVEAMKLGAVDFIQKPFAPKEIRDLVSQVLDRDKLDERAAEDYASCFELAKRCVRDRKFDAAAKHLRKAVALDPNRPEAFNLLGALLDIRGDELGAQKNYRAALSLDPGYEPARANLSRSTRRQSPGDVILGEAAAKPRPRPKEER